MLKFNVIILLTISTSVLSQNGEKNEFLDNSVQPQDNEVYQISSASIGRACNQKNIYSSFLTCLCDKDCSKRNNCCVDKNYCYDRVRLSDEFSCRSTLLHGDIFMIDKCLSNYPYPNIVRKCQTTNQTELVHDFVLSLPVTTKANVTYRNVFCAICNNEPEYLIWNAALHCEVDVNVSQPTPISTNSNIYSNIDPHIILSNLKIDEDRLKLISEDNGTNFNCSVHGYLPYDWVKSINHCSSNIRNSCTICDSSCVNADVTNGKLLAVNLTNSYLPKEPVSVYRRIRNKARDDKNANTCPKPCLINATFSTKSISYVNHNTISIKNLDIQFGPNEWWKTLANDYLYICGDLKPFPISKNTLLYWNDIILSVLVILSIFSLIVFFITSRGKSNNMLDKVIFPLCLTLIALYVVDRIPVWVVPCMKIFSIVSHYLYLSLHVWLLILTYDLWRVICCSSLNRSQIVINKANGTRYLIYCFIGWISPLFVIIVALYFDLSSKDVIPCDLKPEYGATFSCFIEQEKPLAYFYSYPSTVIFCLILLSFGHMAFCVIINKRNKHFKDASYDEYVKYFVKVAVLVLPWTLDLLWIYIHNVYIQMVYFILTAPLGIYVFFAFSFEKEMLSNIYEKIRNSK